MCVSDLSFSFAEVMDSFDVLKYDLFRLNLIIGMPLSATNDQDYRVTHL